MNEPLAQFVKLLLAKTQVPAAGIATWCKRHKIGQPEGVSCSLRELVALWNDSQGERFGMLPDMGPPVPGTDSIPIVLEWTGASALSQSGAYRQRLWRLPQDVKDLFTTHCFRLKQDKWVVMVVGPKGQTRREALRMVPE